MNAKKEATESQLLDLMLSAGYMVAYHGLTEQTKITRGSWTGYFGSAREAVVSLLTIAQPNPGTYHSPTTGAPIDPVPKPSEQPPSEVEDSDPAEKRVVASMNQSARNPFVTDDGIPTCSREFCSSHHRDHRNNPPTCILSGMKITSLPTVCRPTVAAMAESLAGEFE